MKWKRAGIVLFFSVSLYAQSPRGQIAGQIIDITNQWPLIGANVQIIGTDFGAAADDEGRFLIEYVPVGKYALKATMIGYEPEIRSDVVVSSVRPITVNFRLSETVVELRNISVTADYFTNNSDKPISTQSQSNEEIRRLPGGLEDVVRAISILPGVAQVTGGRNDLIVRGGAPSENLYVVDGIEIPNINHFGTQGATGGPLSFINLDYITSTSFSSGGFGAIYGDKLSSVLSLELAEGRNDRPGGKATISASQFGLNLEGPIAEKGSFLVSARRSYLDFIFKSAGFGFVPEYWDFLFKSQIELNPVDKISFIGIGVLDKTRFFNDTPENRYENSRILGNSQNQFIGGVTWRHLYFMGFSEMQISHLVNTFDFTQADTFQTPIFTNKSLEQTTRISGKIVFQPFQSTELSGGFQERFLVFKTDVYLSSFKDEFGDVFSFANDDRSFARKDAVWIQMEQRVPFVRFTIGGRWDQFDQIQQSWVFSPRASMQLRLGSQLTINTSAGQYHQFPSMIWIVSRDLNRNLRAIQADQMIAGMEYIPRSDVKMSLETYYKKYQDYPVSLSRSYLIMANTGAGFGGSEEGWASFGIDPLVSKGTGWSRGIEFFLQKKFSETPFYGTWSVMTSQTRFKALDGIERPGSFDQRWIVNAGGGIVFNKFWEASMRYRMATGRPYTPYNADFSRSAELYNSARIQTNHTIDVRLDKRWFKGRLEWITYVDIQNVLNVKVKDVPRYNAFKGEVEESGSIGILPSIGVSVVF